MRFLLLLFFLSPLFALEDTRIYVEKEENQEIERTTWSLSGMEEKLTAIGINKDGKTTLDFKNKKLVSTFYELSTKDLKIHYKREGGVLHIEKLEGEKKTTKSHSLKKGETWIQRFEFGLEPFLASSNRSCDFYIVYPSNLKLYKMIAKKEGEESIQINGETKVALRVKITLAGFKSFFWDAQLWFDPNTQALLMYRTKKGPKSPLFTFTLQKA